MPAILQSGCISPPNALNTGTAANIVVDARPRGSSVPFPARLGAQRGLCCGRWVGADRRERAARGRPRTGSPLPYVSEGSLPPDPASLACSIAPGRRRA